jgi:hypothetical protein
MIVVLTMLCAGVTSAAAASSIEGVWSFKGGAVDITSQPNGTLVGIVSSPTTFASCVHTVNEEMWSDMHLQPDGSYWGLHQWFAEPGCARNGTGPTAWRVLQNSQGESFLRVCFSEPGSNMQPTIAPDGTSANVTYGCVDSASIAPLPTVSNKEGKAAAAPGEITFKQSVELPNGKHCIKKHRLTIRVHQPAYDPIEELVIRVNHKRVIDVRSPEKLKKAIVLKHLPKGSYTVSVLAITVLKQRLSGSVKYHGCTKSLVGIKLHHDKTRRKQHKA